MVASILHHFSTILQIFIVDLTLSGDNAVVVAMACRHLPKRQMQQAMLIGTGAAVGLRVLLTVLLGLLLGIPTIRLFGAVVLVVIAIRLLIDDGSKLQSPDDEAITGLRGAIATILLADLVMSLDNVVALAAVSGGSILYLMLGLLLSVPLLMYGSTLVARLIQRLPACIEIGGALLGYIAGGLAVSDPLVASRIETQSPALGVIIPLFCALFVVLEGRIIRQRLTQVSYPALVAAPRRQAVRRAAQSSPIPAVAPAETPRPARPTRRTSGRPVGWLAGIGVAAVISGLYVWLRAATPQVHPLGGNVAILAAKPRDVYLCPNGSTVYYGHGDSSIRMRVDNTDIAGFVDAGNRISWDIPPATQQTLSSILPNRIENDAKAVTLSGLTMSATRCPRGG